ncbi:methionine ABC transporter ATP-binding protein [Alkalibacterium olivapovliticus]|uniref:D-methionine transport system ATP-binding protein n=1 Tax=Alkalibacterium olivapovliticus TaxID=99907 RepID=A0A2T0W5L6_9LACT|nr:methionine ABC transporter ATP-binding protein [Alkalibacterium olivapovliticus]PRY81366.1 D-methionine transport system ATP-binding protein [Alkalibacterium olivapovliticus]
MIDLKNIDVHFNTKEQVLHAVRDVSIHINQGDIFGIVGYSGAGKSTLVRTINLLQRPANGSVQVNGQNLLDLTAKELRQARKKIGMIFQHFNLMNSRTVAGNVHYALRSSNLSDEEKKIKVADLLKVVGLADKQDVYPSQLSGGQKQRVGIARALANDPDVLLCDEATSALDPKTTLSILELLKKLNEELGLTIVVITHEMEVIKEICNKVAVMEDGSVVEQGNIVSIFTDPKNPLTQEFINTATHIDQALEKLARHPSLLNLNREDVVVRLSFVGESTNEPLIARLYSKFAVTTNILYGDIEILHDTPIGNLIVILSGSAAQRSQAVHFLESQNVTVQQLEHIQLAKKSKVVPLIREKVI